MSDAGDTPPPGTPLPGTPPPLPLDDDDLDDPLDFDIDALDGLTTLAARGNDDMDVDEDEDGGDETMTSEEIMAMRAADLSKLDKMDMPNLPIWQGAELTGRWLGFSRNGFKHDTTDRTHPFDQWIEKNALLNEVVTKYNEWKKKNPGPEQIREKPAIATIEQGEHPSRQRFSHVTEKDQKTWGAKEWSAWALWKLTNDLCTLDTGPFHDREWSQKRRYQRMWQLWLRVKQRRDKTDEKKGITRPKSRKDEIAARKAIVAALGPQNITDVLKEKRVKALAAAKARATKPSPTRVKDIANLKALQEALDQLDSGAENVVGRANKEAIVESLAEIEEDDEEFFRKLIDESLAQVIEGKKVGIPRATDEDVEASFREALGKVTELKKLYEAELEPGSKEDEAMARLVLDKLGKHEEYRWIKQLQEVQCIITGKEPKQFSAMRTDLAGNLKVNAENIAEDQAGYTAEAADIEALDMEADAASLAATVADHLKIDAENEANRKASSRLTALMSNVKYERTNLKAACKALNIDWREELRILGMKPFGKKLLWWQVAQCHAIREGFKEGLTKGIILAAMVGLGKTCTALAFIILHRNDRMDRLAEIRKLESAAERKAAYKELGPNKPWLIIAPNISLILQWVREATELSDLFDVYIYHKDRNIRIKGKNDKDKDKDKDEDEEDASAEGVNPRKDYALLKKIQDRDRDTALKGHVFRQAKIMTRNCPILHPQEDGRITLILSTSDTYRYRHGPKPHHEWRVKHRVDRKLDRDAQAKLLKSFVKELYTTVDKTWPRYLGDLFFGLIKDEAHDMRNTDAQASIALQWVNALITLMLTATPMWSGVADLRGLLPFCVTPDAQAKYDALPKNLQARKKTANPYSAKLRARQIKEKGKVDRSLRAKALVPQAFEDFTVNYGLVSAGASLDHAQEVVDAVLGETEVRHGYESTPIPGRLDLSIGAVLPAMYKQAIDAYLTEHLLAIYNKYSIHFEQRIRMPVPAKAHKSGKKAGEDDVGVNSNSARALSMASTCPMLFRAGIKKTSKHVADQKAKIEHDRDEHVKRVQEVWEEKYGENGTERNKGGDGEDETGMKAGQKPTRDSILRKVWYNYKTEYSFFELNVIDFVVSVQKSAPKGVCKPTYAAHFILILINNCTDDDVNGDDDEDVEIPDTDAPSSSGSKPKPFGCDDYFTDLPPNLPTDKNHLPPLYRRTIARIWKSMSPRLGVVADIAFDCHKRKEKCSFWWQYPGTQWLCYAFLTMTTLKARMFHAGLDTNQREELIDAWNTEGSDFQFMSCSYKVGSQGLNLHKDSHILCLGDAPLTVSQRLQTEGRAFRLGQTKETYIFSIEVPKTYDSQIGSRSLIRSAGEVRARIDGAQLAEQTGARCPSDQTREEFIESLKMEWSNFYLNPDETKDKRIRHATAFDLDENEEYEIPEGYTLLDQEDLSRELYNMLTGRSTLKAYGAPSAAKDPADNDGDTPPPGTPDQPDVDPTTPSTKGKGKGKKRRKLNAGKGADSILKESLIVKGTDIYKRSSYKTKERLVEICEELGHEFKRKQGKNHKVPELQAIIEGMAEEKKAAEETSDEESKSSETEEEGPVTRKGRKRGRPGQ